MRIALMSDLHCGILSTTKELTVCGEAVEIGESVNAVPLFTDLIRVLKKERPEYLFIAGDLTSTGSPLEFKHCYDKIIQLAEEIELDLEKVVFCLGNHDVDWRISDIASDYKLEDSAYEQKENLKNSYHGLAQSWATEVYSHKIERLLEFKSGYKIPISGVKEFEDFIVFVLNSGHLSARDQKYKHGCLSKAQYDWFEEALKTYKNDTRFKIVLLHHHLSNYPYPTLEFDLSLLEEGGDLLKKCGEAGVDLILHGHRHHPIAKTSFETSWIKPITLICSGSLSVNAYKRQGGAIPNTFHIIDFNQPEEIVLSNYFYREGSGWQPLTHYSKETPLDEKMWFGKIVEESAAIDILKKLPKNKIIEYSSLDAQLKYVPLNLLNKYLSQAVNGNYRVIGRFPNEVTIVEDVGGI